jgi:3-oxoacyl-[acyl-carrier protein] reductase
MNQIDLKGRNAVITGGARGIGFAIAKRMLESGASVALWDRDADALAAAAKTLAAGSRVTIETVDLVDDKAVGAAAASSISKLKSVDILVNNAGIAGANMKTWEYTPADFRQIIEINMISQYLVCRAVVPHMMERKYGRIVNIASIAGKEGNPNASAYSVSKAGVIALTKSLGKELATAGITVNAITPAAAKTDIFKQMKEEHINYMLSKIPMNRFVEVDEIAALAAWLASEDCSFSTAAVFDISGGRGTY